MQRMFNLSKWQVLRKGEALQFVNPRPRNVRIEVNAPTASRLYIVTEDGDLQFLARVEGRDTIEFGTDGAFDLTTEDDEVAVYTADGDDISMRVIAPVIFTKIANRRPRNPELEAIAARMAENMERRLAHTAAEFERKLAEGRSVGTPVAPAPAVPEPAASEPESDGDGKPSDSQTPAASGGSEPDGGSPDAG